MLASLKNFIVRSSRGEFVLTKFFVQDPNNTS